MKKISLSMCLIGIISLLNVSMAQTPAFPSAEGYGKYAKGGRGGKVVFVTNLSDYDAYGGATAIPGSFRWALTQYPGDSITIIFRVSGIIQLVPHLVTTGSTVKNSNEIRCTRAKMTIAGQTAPGEGILIRNGRVNLGGCTDLVVRNMRFRVGENAADSTFLPGGSVDCENAVRVMFDHCNFGWSGEENLTFYDNRYTTIQWSIFHDALYDDGHGKGNRGYGSQTGGICATYHHNLWTNNKSRSPRLNGARTDNETNVFIEFINNVVYNWGGANAAYGGDILATGTRSHTCNFVGNYYKPGPATPTSNYYYFTNYINYGASSIPQWYLSGNIMDGSTSLTTNNWNGFTWKWSTAGTTLPTKATAGSDTMLIPPASVVYNSAWVGYTPYKLSTIQSATDAYNEVLNKVGTYNRDSVERRVIREVKNKTATFYASLGTSYMGIIDKTYNAEGYRAYASATAPTDTDNDGMPDDWEIANGLNANNPDDRNIKTSEGYTALEVYLASLMGENIPHSFISAVKNVSAYKLTVYPGVTNSKLSVISDTQLKNALIFDQQGKQVASKSLENTNVIDVSGLCAGCYLIQTTNQNGDIAMNKFVKN